MTRSIARHRFDSPNTCGGRFLPHNSERADVASRSYVRTAAEFHRVAVQRGGLAADLPDPHTLTVLVTKELLDVGTLLRLRVRNLGDVINRRILPDLFVDQILYIALL